MWTCVEKTMECVGCYRAGKNWKTKTPQTEKNEFKYLSQPNEELQLDFHGTIEGSGPKRWILLGVDRFLKLPVASVVGSTTARIMVKFMENYITTYGLPEKIVTDQGTVFTGREFKRFCGRLNIE